MIPQDQLPKCIPPSFYAACVADMDEQKLDDNIRDSYLAVAFLSANFRAAGLSEPHIEQIGMRLARHFAAMSDSDMWPECERIHRDPMSVFLLFVDDEQTDGDT